MPNLRRWAQARRCWSFRVRERYPSDLSSAEDEGAWVHAPW
ncbi:hypothetical protein [Parathermosynechococcus lividus]|nr:hypothetical protein [Thermostichus lividus]